MSGDDTFDDLRARLRRTRFTTASDQVAWAVGVDPDHLRSLVGHWAETFDWRAAEARLNGYPRFGARTGSPVPEITVPSAITLSNEPAYPGYPRSLAERKFRGLRHWHVPERGGHFMAHEEPEQLAADVRAFLARWRDEAHGTLRWDVLTTRK